MKTACRTFLLTVIVLIYVLSVGKITKADQTVLFDIKCVNSYIKQGKPQEDFRTKTGQIVKCGDSAVLSLLDNHRILLQTTNTKNKISNIYGFSGSGFKHIGDKLWVMPIEHMYLPPTGATVDVDSELGGGCLFAGSDDIAKVKHITCTANIIPNSLLRTVYHIEFDVIKNAGTLPQAKAKDSFDKISQYTLMNETLPDGKHPVWVYYEITGKTVIRVTIPSLDICGVMSDSKSDIDILNSNMTSTIKKNSRDWNMALDIWQTAFDKYMLTGAPTHCK